MALQALSAVLGGAQSLHVNAKDEALGLPTEATALLALRTQQVLAYESGVSEVVDPLGGSWFVEKLTKDLEEEAKAYLERIHSLGGMLQAIESGYVQREIQEAAYAQQARLESGEEVMVGVNRFESQEEVPIERLRIDPEVEKGQISKLKKLRKRRDSCQVKGALEKIGRAAQGQSNLMPVVIEAVEAYATVGEIADAMRDVFGEHKETIVI